MIRTTTVNQAADAIIRKKQLSQSIKAPHNKRLCRPRKIAGIFIIKTKIPIPIARRTKLLITSATVNISYDQPNISRNAETTSVILLILSR